MKQLDHERKIKKKGEEKMQVDSDEANMSIKCDNDLEIKTDDLVVSYLYDVLLVISVTKQKNNFYFNIFRYLRI